MKYIIFLIKKNPIIKRNLFYEENKKNLNDYYKKKILLKIINL